MGPAIYISYSCSCKLLLFLIMQIMFEKFQVPALGLALSAMLSMYTLGRTTGTVLDCGEGVTYTVPVYEGAAIPRAIVRFPHLVGSDLSDHLFKLLTDRDPQFTTKGSFVC